MTQDTYPYERPFRLRIIASCLDASWYTAKGVTAAKPEYFNTKEEAELVKFINQFYQKYHHAPCIDELAAQFAEADEMMGELICEVVDTLDTNDLAYAKDTAIKFARTQARWIALDKSIQMFQQGKEVDDIWPMFKEADRVGEDAQDLGLDLINDADAWLYNTTSETDRIATGIVHLDQASGGGVGRGEYWLIVGPPGSGKTRTMVNIGLGAASIITKANVLHITLEMSAKNIARRYGARLTGGKLIHGDELEFKHCLITEAGRKLRGTIRIKQYPNKRLTHSELNRYLDTLAMEGFVPDLMIMDYSTNMRHNHSNQEYRHQLGDTSEELRGLAVERNMGVVDGAQVNRGAFKKEIVDLDDIAECWDQTATADAVFTICQLKTEKAENLLRLFAAKFREEESNWMVRCRVDPVLHMLESIEKLTLSELFQLQEEKRDKQLQIIK